MEHVSLQITGDGSHTLYNATLNETYHSDKGAVAESKYVFIDSGLKLVLSSKSSAINLLEIGFGTGLNALMTMGFLNECVSQHIDIPWVHYVSLEPFPINTSLITQLNYPQLLPVEYTAFFSQLHQATWNAKVQLSSSFDITKQHCSLEKFSSKDDLFDLIYFDAFAPSKQPDVWSLANIEKCFSLLKPNGLLVSYCANGQFKRNLKAAGFTVKAHPGALGKREMTRAWKYLNG